MLARLASWDPLPSNPGCAHAYPQPRISGTLPAPLLASWRDSMRVLELGVNAFSGPLPPEFGDMSALTSLSLGVNAFEGSIPPNWGSNWPSLQHLGIDQLHSLTMQQLPARFANLTELETLGIDGSNFFGTIPREWGAGMRSLRILHYQDNLGLSGCLPPQFKDVTGYNGEPLSSPAMRTNTQVKGFCRRSAAPTSCAASGLTQPAD